MRHMMEQYGAGKGREVFSAKAHEMGRQWHKSPDSYDDRALGEIPPRDHYSKDPDVGSDPRPSATGTPVGVVTADGTANLGTTTVTQGPIVKQAPTGSPDARPSGVRSYQDGVV